MASQFVTGARDGTVRIWNVGAEKAVAVFDGQAGAIEQVVISADGTIVAGVESERQVVHLWNTATGDSLAELRNNSLAKFSPNGNVLVTRDYSEHFYFWDVPTGRPRSVLPDTLESVAAVVLSPTGTLAYTRLWDSRGFLWNTATGDQILLDIAPGDGWRAVFNPDETMLATGSLTGLLQVWNTATGRRMAALEGHQGRVETLLFSPNGRLLASGGRDGLVCLWDVQGERLQTVLQGHQDFVGSLAWHPNGNILASGDGDGFIRMWNTATGRDLTVLYGDYMPVVELTFNSTGTALASWNQDGVLRLWGVRSSAE